MVMSVRSSVPVLVTVIRQNAVLPAGSDASVAHGPAPPAPQSAESSDRQTSFVTTTPYTFAAAVAGPTTTGAVSGGAPGGT